MVDNYPLVPYSASTVALLPWNTQRIGNEFTSYLLFYWIEREYNYLYILSYGAANENQNGYWYIWIFVYSDCAQ